MGARARISTFMAVVGAVVIAACGGSSGNGVASKSASQIVTASTNALKSASSVHFSGSGTDNGQSVRIDMTIKSGTGAQGSVTIQGQQVGLITLGNYFYLKAAKSFWVAQKASPAEAQLLADKWLKLPVSSSNAQSFSSFTNLSSIASQLAQAKGTVTKGSTTTVGGQKAIQIKDASKGGSLFVATTGKPYPLKVTSSTDSGLVLSFDHYNASVKISAPPNPVDSSKLAGS